MHRQNAFSLVELSIVLVILGLLVGGILAGQSLIRASELRSISNDFNRYQTAVYAFKDKYFAIPGDMANATSFWGAADGNDGLGTDCVDASGTGPATCNGDGNGMLLASDGTLPANSFAPEWFHAWKQLANAGLVEGTFTGTRYNNPRSAYPGKNVPLSKIGGAGYTLMSTTASGDTWYYNGSYKLLLVFGTRNANVETNNAILTSNEAWNVDVKMDDGMPGLGKLRTFHDSANCVSDISYTAQATATYNLAISLPKSCNLMYSFDNPGQ